VHQRLRVTGEEGGVDLPEAAPQCGQRRPTGVGKVERPVGEIDTRVDPLGRDTRGVASPDRREKGRRIARRLRLLERLG
jgi:hypothetical protein